MKILLLSNSFTTKDSLHSLFESTFESTSIVKASGLKRYSVSELMNYDFIFIEIDEYLDQDVNLIYKIKYLSSNLKVMILDRSKSYQQFKDAVNNSIDGYIVNLNDREEFIFNVKKIVSGKKIYDSDLIYDRAESNDVFGVDSLTKREKEVLDQIAKGLNNKSIASSLYITEYTVKKHVSNIFSKLNLTNRQEAIIYANKF
ncbi:MAG: response regulator transcription factor [Paraclostridium sp.]